MSSAKEKGFCETLNQLGKEFFQKWFTKNDNPNCNQANKLIEAVDELFTTFSDDPYFDKVKDFGYQLLLLNMEIWAFKAERIEEEVVKKRDGIVRKALEEVCIKFNTKSGDCSFTAFYKIYDMFIHEYFTILRENRERIHKFEQNGKQLSDIFDQLKQFSKERYATLEKGDTSKYFNVNLKENNDMPEYVKVMLNERNAISEQLKNVSQEINNVSEQLKNVFKEINNISSHVQNISTECNEQIQKISKEINNVSEQLQIISTELSLYKKNQLEESTILKWQQKQLVDARPKDWNIFHFTKDAPNDCQSRNESDGTANANPSNIEQTKFQRKKFRDLKKPTSSQNETLVNSCFSPPVIPNELFNFTKQS